MLFAFKLNMPPVIGVAAAEPPGAFGFAIFRPAIALIRFPNFFITGPSEGSCPRSQPYADRALPPWDRP